MSFFNRDPWKQVTPVYAHALKSRLTVEEFTRLTQILVRLQAFRQRIFQSREADDGFALIALSTFLSGIGNVLASTGFSNDAEFVLRLSTGKLAPGNGKAAMTGPSLASLVLVLVSIGKNEEAFGTRFPDMSEPYRRELIDKALSIATEANYEVKQGVYIGVTGPTFETRAEYKMLHILGGNAVGMSTVQEVIAAVHMGLPVFAMSVITDIGIREEENIITHEEVLQAAKDAEPKLTHIFKELIRVL